MRTLAGVPGGLALTVVSAFAATAEAKEAPRVVIVPAAADVLSLRAVVESATRLARALAARGKLIARTEDAAHQVERVLPLPRGQGPSFASVLADARRAFFYDQDYARARELLRRVRSESARCEEHRDATLLLTVVALTEGKEQEAASLLEEALREEPRLYLSPRDHPPPLRKLAEAIRQRLDAGPRAVLHVIGRPSGVRVHVGLCRQGKLPTVLEPLYPGSYRVWAEGGRVRSVRIRAGRTTVELDSEFDAAIRTSPTLALIGLPVVRRVSDVAHLARLAGAGEAVLVEAATDQVSARLVDAQTGRVVRQARSTAAAIADIAGYLATGAGGVAILGDRPPPPSPRRKKWYERRGLWAWVSAGLGAGAATAGLLAGKSARASEEAIRSGQQAGTLTLPRYQGLAAGAQSDARAANILFGAAGAFGVTALVLFLVGDAPEPATKPGAWRVEPAGAGVTVRVGF